MPEYITKEAVKQAMRSQPRGILFTEWELDQVPTVDAVEVVHGRWIVRAEFNNGERVIAACSNCNVQGEVRTNRNEWCIWHIHSPYCPNCGAKMDGGV